MSVCLHDVLSLDFMEKPWRNGLLFGGFALCSACRAIRSERSIIPGCLVVSVERRQPGALAAALRASRPRCMTIETEREADGSWIAKVSELPGVMVYGVTEAEARAKVTALAWRVLVDRLEMGEAVLD